MNYQSVAVVDANAEAIIIWHVDVSPDPSGLSRMCGAWVLEGTDVHTFETLTRGRYLATTPAGGAVRDGLRPDHHRGVLDLGRVDAEIASVVDRFQELFKEAAAASKSTLIEPTWPRLPGRIDPENPPADGGAPERVAVALGIARWLESMALVWESLEVLRESRKYLRGENEGQREFPVALLDQQSVNA